MSNGNSSLLSITGLGKTYGTGKTAVPVLRDVSLSVGKGEFCALKREILKLFVSDCHKLLGRTSGRWRWPSVSCQRTHMNSPEICRHLLS